jgi:hypothetical protein
MIEASMYTFVHVDLLRAGFLSGKLLLRVFLLLLERDEKRMVNLICLRVEGWEVGCC